LPVGEAAVRVQVVYPAAAVAQVGCAALQRQPVAVVF
jgi:hypothetical protein